VAYCLGNSGLRRATRRWPAMDRGSEIAHHIRGRRCDDGAVRVAVFGFSTDLFVQFVQFVRSVWSPDHGFALDAGRPVFRVPGTCGDKLFETASVRSTRRESRIRTCGRLHRRIPAGPGQGRRVQPKRGRSRTRPGQTSREVSGSCVRDGRPAATSRCIAPVPAALRVCAGRQTAPVRHRYRLRVR